VVLFLCPKGSKVPQIRVPISTIKSILKEKLIMKKLTTLFIFLFGFAAMSWTTYDGFPLPFQKLQKAVYKLLDIREDMLFNYRSLKEESVKEFSDTTLHHFYSDRRFYSLIVFDGRNCAYNAGVIPIIATISTTNDDDIRILVPLPYAASSPNFFEQFYGQPISDKPRLAKAIAEMFYMVYPRIYHEIKDYQIVATESEGLVTVTTSWVVIFDKKDFLQTEKTIFHFCNDTLTCIDYDDWRNWR
jgi:hypothetical protein